MARQVRRNEVAFLAQRSSVWLMNTCLQEEFHGSAAPGRNNSDAGARLILLRAQVLNERGDPKHQERKDDDANQCHCHRHPGRHCRHVHHLERSLKSGPFGPLIPKAAREEAEPLGI
jgi:hypothetical protein